MNLKLKFNIYFLIKVIVFLPASTSTNFDRSGTYVIIIIWIYLIFWNKNKNITWIKNNFLCKITQYIPNKILSKIDKNIILGTNFHLQSYKVYSEFQRLYIEWWLSFLINFNWVVLLLNLFYLVTHSSAMSKLVKGFG